MPGMATTTYEYNEVSHSSMPVGGSDVNGLDPMYHYDTHFPERLSRLHMTPEYSSPVVRRSKGRSRNRAAARFKTQPITFDEIKEVDEEVPGASGAGGGAAGARVATFDRAKEGLLHQFAAFSRSMDGMLPVLQTGRLDASPLIKPASAVPATPPSSPVHGATASSTASPDLPGQPTTAARAAPGPAPGPGPGPSPSPGTGPDTGTGTDQGPDPGADTQGRPSGITLPPGLPMDDHHYRSRRRLKKKKHNRSIEEAPELLKNNEENFGER